MGREEQKEEREVLDSIFPDEITDIDENSYRVSVTLDLQNAREDEDEEQPSLWLTVIYPETYPDVAPRLDLSLPPNAARVTDLDLSADKAALLESLEEAISENLGMAMVFTLVSTLKENVEALIAERRAAAETAREKVAEAQEAKENEKFHGTPVTAETFVGWREGFRKEMREAADKAKADKEVEDKKRRAGAGAGAKGEGKMTGRQLWEGGLAGKAGEEDDDEDGGEDALKGIEKLGVKA